MPITGCHMLLYSSQADALRNMLRDVFSFPSVDAGGGWLIFGLPPAEIGVHPGEQPKHELTFMCDDIDATISELRSKGVRIEGEPQNQGWGTTVIMTLPGDVHVMLYQPHHPVAINGSPQ